MTLAAHHPLHGVKLLLEEIARKGDGAGLRSALAGENLPALGGDLHPAQILHQALSLPPFEPGLVRSITEILAKLCEETAEGPIDEPLAFNLFLLASNLPAVPALFEALKRFCKRGAGSGVLFAGSGRAERQLRQALVYQQTDDSLDGHWLDLIRQQTSRGGALDAERKAELLDAWTGLLWIPPGDAARLEGETLSIERVTRGLKALYDAVEATLDALPMLRFALRQLDEAYPRSAEFWVEALRPHPEAWPEILRGLVAERWVSVEAGEVWEASMPTSESTETLRASGVEWRTEITKAAATRASAKWVWKQPVLRPPPGDFHLTGWRRAIQRLRRMLRAGFEGLIKRRRVGAWTEADVAKALSYTLEDLEQAHLDEIDALFVGYNLLAGKGIEISESAGDQVGQLKDRLKLIRYRVVRKAVAELAREQRVPLFLQLARGLSYREIAVLLQTPPKVVKARIYEARQRIKTELEGQVGKVG